MLASAPEKEEREQESGRILVLYGLKLTVKSRKGTHLKLFKGVIDV